MLYESTQKSSVTPQKSLGFLHLVKKDRIFSHPLKSPVNSQKSLKFVHLLGKKKNISRHLRLICCTAKEPCVFLRESVRNFTQSRSVCMCVCVCMRACMRACVCLCLGKFACVRGWVGVCVSICVSVTGMRHHIRVYASLRTYSALLLCLRSVFL